MVTDVERVIGGGGGISGTGAEAIIRYETQTHGGIDGNFILKGSYRHREARSRKLAYLCRYNGCHTSSGEEKIHDV